MELECSRSFIPTKSGKKVSHCKVKDVDMKSDFFACQVYMTSDYKLSADSSVLSMLELAQYMHRFQDEFVHCIDVSFGNDWFPF